MPKKKKKAPANLEKLRRPNMRVRLPKELGDKLRKRAEQNGTTITAEAVRAVERVLGINLEEECKGK